jgi:hypothetical protein
MSSMIERGFALILMCAMSAVLACTSEPAEPGGDTQTNWLKACTQDSECGELSCECGVCSRPCSSTAECAGAPAGTSCFAPDSAETQAACGENAAYGLCLQPLSATLSAPTALDFCPEFYGAMCERVANCGCGAAAATNCSEEWVAECATSVDFLEFAALVDQGALVYDAVAAETLIRGLRAPGAACDDLVVTLGIDSYRAHSLGGVFVGTVPAGGDCGADDDPKKNMTVSRCGEGHLCLTGTDGRNTCVPFAGLGEACPVIPDNAGSSCLLRQGPDRDGEFQSASETLSCIPDGPGSTTGTCEQRAPDGSPCDEHPQCASGHCGDDGCFQPLADGEACLEESDCASWTCGGGAASVCVTRLPDGSSCTASYECASSLCSVPAGGAQGTCTAPTQAPAELGAPCTESAGCVSGYCEIAVAGGTCVERACQGHY